MNKTPLSVITILILIVIFIYAFSVSYASSNIDNSLFIIGLAIDKADDDKNLKISFEFTDLSPFSQDSSAKKAEPILETVTASSIETAINLMNVYLSKEVDLSHCQLIAISDEVASHGIYSEFSEFINNTQLRPTANIIVTKGSASNYFKKSSSSLDIVLTKYYDVFPNSSKYTGYTSNVKVGQFYNSLLADDSGSTAILGGTNTNSVDSTSPSDIKAGNSSITGDRGTENIGLAVFNKDKYVGDLSALETLCHTILTSEVDTFLLTVDAPNNISQKMDIPLEPNTNTEISVDISNDIPIINININLSGKISTGLKDLDYSDANVLNDVSNIVKTTLEKNISDYLKKTQDTFKCDIDYFYTYAKRNFLTIDEWKNFDWYSKYPKAKFNVNVNCNVVSSFIVSGI